MGPKPTRVGGGTQFHFFGGGMALKLFFPIFAKAQMALQLWSVAIFAHELGTSARR